MYQEIINVT